jgi:hypothetical protein
MDHIAIVTGMASRRKSIWLVCERERGRTWISSALNSLDPALRLEAQTHRNGAIESIAKLGATVESSNDDHETANGHADDRLEDAFAAQKRDGRLLELGAGSKAPVDHVGHIDAHDDELNDNTDEHDPAKRERS